MSEPYIVYNLLKYRVGSEVESGNVGECEVERGSKGGVQSEVEFKYGNRARVDNEVEVECDNEGKEVETECDNQFEQVEDEQYKRIYNYAYEPFKNKLRVHSESES